VRGVGRLSMAQLVRSASTSELGRCYWRGRWGRRSTRGDDRREGGLDNEGGGRLRATTVLVEGSGVEAHEGGVQWPALGVEVYSEKRSRVGEHSVAVAVKRRRKVWLATALRRRGPTRGAALGAAAACAARGGRKAGGTRRSSSWRGRHAALAVGTTLGTCAVGKGRVGRASPSRCGFGPVTK
jgi:hypothetical protein